MDRPRVALHWCAGCGGCEQAVLDLGPALARWAERLEIVYWPLACDGKVEAVEALGDGELDVCFLSGAVRTEADREMAHLFRRKARRVVALGSCAQTGGVVGLGNLHPASALWDRAYREMETLAPQEGVGSACDPHLLPRAAPVHEHVAVEYAVPGCPPVPEAVDRVLAALVEDRLPPPGTVFAEEEALCRTCPRAESLPREPVSGWRRPATAAWDATRCFLTQGLACLGPATRGGCGARCIGGNFPCRGCFGPASAEADLGTLALSALAVAGGSDGDVPPADPVGLFYRYTLADSLLPGCGRRRGPRGP